MTSPSLSDAETVDLANVHLDFEGFRELARNPHLSLNEKIGFPDVYRAGYDEAIFRDILTKLPVIAAGAGRTVVEIGPGCAALPRKLIDLCRERGHQLILVDSPEMLDLLPAGPGVVPCPGLFPKNASEVSAAADRQVDALLCYSVLQYIYLDSNLFDFIDAVVGLLAPGGRALIGDIPNHSKRRRFFASEAGQRFHEAYSGGGAPYEVKFNEPVPGKIDDAVLAGLVQRAQAAGCDAYLMPQGHDLPMANRRDDLLIARP